MKTAIYRRVSTTNQADHGYGLPIQEQECRSRAAQLGWEVVTVLTDDCSGDLRDRPGLDKLRSLVQQGMVEAVLSG